MTTKIAINGFGRIGRCVLRALVENGFDGIEVVAINDLAAPDTLLHLLKYDSVHGRLKGEARLDGDTLHVAGQAIRLTAERDPAKLPWADVDVTYECTGFFTERDKAAAHFQNGSKRVLISAPGKNVDRTVVYGVNHTEMTADDRIVSNASCTTNCLAPIAKVLDDAFGIESGTITTIHSSMHDQQVIDAYHPDLRRSRAASQSIIPVDTKLAVGIERILPKFKGRFEAIAVRVPTLNVTAMDLSVTVNEDVSIDAINQVIQQAQTTPLTEHGLQGILAYTEEPLVSVDFNHDTHSCIVDGNQTRVSHKRLVKMLIWCDNEWGFANRMLDTAEKMALVSS